MLHGFRQAPRISIGRASKLFDLMLDRLEEIIIAVLIFKPTGLFARSERVG